MSFALIIWLEAYGHRSDAVITARYARCAHYVRHTRFARYASALRGARQGLTCQGNLILWCQEIYFIS